MNNFFSSDYHFNHSNVIDYDDRPFIHVDEMNDAIIYNHNSVVGKNDNFYFLGDLSFSKSHSINESFLKQLNGNLFFIKGNHDRDIKLLERYGTYLGEQKMIKISDQEIVLNHYRMMVWNKSAYGSWHLFGHSHGKIPDDPNSYTLDVGIMNNDYYPFSFDDIKAKMAMKNVRQWRKKRE